jgi:adenine/guanine/hypoxanthine permease
LNHYRWATSGDVNAFFGLMLDNTAALLLMVGLLGGAFGFPESFALRYMIPGTALGVLVGDLLFTWMAFHLARSSGRNDITAMPLGIDTPSTIGMVFFVLGPAYLAGKTSGLAEQEAATYAWRIGMCAIITSGVFKLACSLAAGWVRQVVPRAGLLGSLAAIAMVLISFLPLLDVARVPVVGFLSLALVLATLVSRLPLPGRIPGALGAVFVGTVIYYLMQWTGTLGAVPIEQTIRPELGFVMPWPTLQWWEVYRDSLVYLPIVVPFALATVVGGIDCTESAAAVGDEYHTGQVVAVEALATLVAGLFGGVIQTTPYIGHPAYKAMGGRAAYTLATALFIGGAGMFGYFAYLYLLIPKAAILPILVFISRHAAAPLPGRGVRLRAGAGLPGDDLRRSLARPAGHVGNDTRPARTGPGQRSADDAHALGRLHRHKFAVGIDTGGPHRSPTEARGRLPGGRRRGESLWRDPLAPARRIDGVALEPAGVAARGGGTDAVLHGERVCAHRGDALWMGNATRG